jgi:isocitrate/isopropylmalate dehydrogenase
MLEHLGETDAARRVRTAVRSVLAEGSTLTADLGGRSGTTEVAEAIAARVAATS